MKNSHNNTYFELHNHHHLSLEDHLKNYFCHDLYPDFYMFLIVPANVELHFVIVVFLR